MHCQKSFQKALLRRSYYVIGLALIFSGAMTSGLWLPHRILTAKFLEYPVLVLILAVPVMFHFLCGPGAMRRLARYAGLECPSCERGIYKWPMNPKLAIEANECPLCHRTLYRE